jgi:chorismate--pyruvate lyase
VTVQDYSAVAAAPLLPLDLWMPVTALLRGMPASLAAWLTEPGLLTARIAAVSGAPHGLTLLDQRLGFLSREQQALLAAPATSCLVREVQLTARGEAWIFAQSLVPDHTLELHPWLAELGDSSLGATLDAIAGLERGPFEFAPLPAAHPLAARALAGDEREPGPIWARRSWFALRGRRLLVHEVFLPGLGQC